MKNIVIMKIPKQYHYTKYQTLLSRTVHMFVIYLVTITENNTRVRCRIHHITHVSCPCVITIESQ